ncbi:MAG: DUF2924 domain-containing protein [Alphaproteobacteria bacterium]|nr:DUF2924 domain-containing protein [Alphaproteobacteria bacterium]
MARRVIDREALGQEVAGLPTLPASTLHEYWHRLFDQPMPSHFSRKLLVRAIAYKLQENAFGGLKPSIARFLDKAAVDLAAGKGIAAPAPSFKPGTRLLREWHGETHEVMLLEDGVRYRGETYRSLTEVARTITGTHWSGPRFFGVVAQEVRNAAE